VSALTRLAWLAVAGFLLHGNWEWLQSPFYRDSATSLDRIVWFRVHCTLGDVLILLVGALAVSVIVRSTDWLARPRWAPIVLLTVVAMLYTAASERRNLTAGGWSYSERMPIVPWLGVGLVPLLQWLVLSSLSVRLAARLSRENSQGEDPK
jgi:hypothetical protein